VKGLLESRTGAAIVERYLLLSLRLGRHIDGFVDFYYGPPELAQRVKGEEPPPPGALADEAREIGRASCRERV
jgi:hypothetical protein